MSSQLLYMQQAMGMLTDGRGLQPGEIETPQAGSVAGIWQICLCSCTLDSFQRIT